MRKGQDIDHGKDIDYNVDKDTEDEKKLIETVAAVSGLKIEIWNVDLQHALMGHPEVTIERVRKALQDPYKVIKSKYSNRACLFYSFEIPNDPVFGEVYFCVVVVVDGKTGGKGKMETAYETTFIKKGEVLFPKGDGK